VADGPMIDRLRELDSAATPPNWDVLSVCRVYSRHGMGLRVEHDGIDHSTGEQLPDELVEYQEGADAALIAEARNALPKLLAIAEAARFPRNVAVGDGAEMHHGDRFQGEWVAVPAQDFDRLRASVAALDNR
jgi:hypothetical protein